MRFFTSDPHFQHIHGLDFRNGRFKTLDEMNWTIINNINSVVTENDTLYILGDVFFQPKKLMSQNQNIFNNILCKDIKVAVGNHDSIANLITAGFKAENIFDTRMIKIQGEEFVMGHLPYIDYRTERDITERAWLPFPSIQNNPNTGKPYNRLSGHVHEAWRIRPHNLNCGVDVNNFMPLSETDIMELFQATHGFTSELDNVNNNVVR